MIEPGDAPHLERTIEIAARAHRATAPNPRVGAVLVQAGEVIGEGWHRRAGEPHAETLALAEAGGRAAGATLYTSLEPCTHRGRTPPCTEAIRAAKIARVVVALEDPDPRVAGKGIEALRAAGIVVDVADGEIAHRAAELNEDYLVHRREGRAFAALKVAATLDGRIADRDGASRWITGPAARTRGRELRGRYGAILVGVGTALADDPVLLPTVSDASAPPFLRCVLDSRLRLAPSARLFTAPEAHGAGSPVLVFAGPDAPADRARALSAAGAEIVTLGPPGGPIPPAEILRELGRRGVLGVLVEGGGATHGLFLEAGVADKMYWFAAPRVFGDPEARPAVLAGPRPLSRLLTWRTQVVERLEEDILLVLYPSPDPR